MGIIYYLNLYILKTTLFLPATHSNKISSLVKRKIKDKRNKSSQAQHKIKGLIIYLFHNAAHFLCIMTTSRKLRMRKKPPSII
jgi:hypothetical protein